MNVTVTPIRSPILQTMHILSSRFAHTTVYSFYPVWRSLQNVRGERAAGGVLVTEAQCCCWCMATWKAPSSKWWTAQRWYAHRLMSSHAHTHTLTHLLPLHHQYIIRILFVFLFLSLLNRSLQWQWTELVPKLVPLLWSHKYITLKCFVYHIKSSRVDWW